MPSERIQRRIDRLLDEAEAVADAQDSAHSAELSREALALDRANEDAAALPEATQEMLGSPSLADPEPAPPTEPTNEPDSFAGGRYVVTIPLSAPASAKTS